MNRDAGSWNRLPRVHATRRIRLVYRTNSLPKPLDEADRLLPYGNGRSYGDVCLIEDGTLLLTRGLDRFISFNPETGSICCEAGILLKDILDLVVPQGWFLAVTPGTRFVTLGGAIANDVHGKNHHVAGSFGNHVLRFELVRSDGARIICSHEVNPEWFAATIGGLGLTGLIAWAEIQLLPIANAGMLTESRRFESLEEFWEINEERGAKWPYTVAWIDCIAGGRRRGRGIYVAAEHARGCEDLPAWRERSRSVPIDPPFSLVNAMSLRIFNSIYYRRSSAQQVALAHYVPFFYPLDSVLNWNRIYGRKGFFQYQCVIPPAASRDGIEEIMRCIRGSGQGSFLSVLKTFGNISSRGMLSFAREGVTFALDFANHDQSTLKLFEQLDAIVLEAGGAIYPAKDARMPSALFRAGFPQWERFSTCIDPHFSSSFWRRISS